MGTCRVCNWPATKSESTFQHLLSNLKDPKHAEELDLHLRCPSCERLFDRPSGKIAHLKNAGCRGAAPQQAADCAEHGVRVARLDNTLQKFKPCSASAYMLVGAEWRASSSPGLPLGWVPLSSQRSRVLPSSTSLPSTTDTLYDLSTPSIADHPPSSYFPPSGRSTLDPEIESAELSMGLQLRQRDQQLVTFLQVPNPRLQLQLSVQRRVPDTAESIWFAMKGDIRALRILFSRGLASPVEVSSSRGLSLIAWALYAGRWNYPTVQFLVLECKAPVDDWSYDHAWEFAFRNGRDATELKGLECVLLNPNIYRDWFEEQKFPEAHKIVLYRSSQLLVTELDDNPWAVHATDAKGRTALAWATARAQLDDMKLLIARGSLVDMMDVDGRSILLNAVDSSNNDGLRIILEAGANPNPVVPEGLFRSSPLIAAAIGSKLEMLKLLIDFGATIDAANPEGWTALQAAIKARNVECANLLLTRGANLDYISKNGHSALTTAIIYNSHAVLKLLIDRYHTNPLKGLQLLPVIARSADVETMSILGASALKQTLLNGCSFAASYKILQSRTDYNERLGNAFNEFLSVAGPKRR